MRRATLADLDAVNGWVERDAQQGVDFSEFLASDLNVCLIEGEGGALFAWRGPGIYEVHVFFEQRGRQVLSLSHRMLDYMRASFGAWLFWAAVPVDARRVIMFTRLMGWKSQGQATFPHGPCEVFTFGER